MLDFAILTEENLALEQHIVEIGLGQEMPIVLERFCWLCLKDMATGTNQSIAELCRAAATVFPDLPIENAVTSYVLQFFRHDGRLEIPLLTPLN